MQKTGLVRFTEWYEEAFGIDTPWGHEDSPTLVTEAESGLERALSVRIMNDATIKIVTLQAGGVLVEQGAHGQELFLLLDGVLSVEVDGVPVAPILWDENDVTLFSGEITTLTCEHASAAVAGGPAATVVVEGFNLAPAVRLDG